MRRFWRSERVMWQGSGVGREYSLRWVLEFQRVGWERSSSASKVMGLFGGRWGWE